NYRWHIERFWSSIAVIQAMTWSLVAVASWLTPKSWQEHPSTVGHRSWGERFRDWAYGVGEKRKRHRMKLLNVNAFYWLASRVRLKPLAPWGGLGAIALWWLFVSTQD